MALQGLTAQSTIEAELVAAVMTMKEAVFCSSMMLELDFDESFGSMSLYIGNMSALHVTSKHTYSLHAKHIALRFDFSNTKTG